MKSTPSSGRRFSTACTFSGSFAGPQTPSPTMRIAPYPRRVTSRSPPILNVPDAAAEIDAMSPTIGRLAHGFAPQRRPGVFTVGGDDRPPPDDAAKRLRGAVAAH